MYRTLVCPLTSAITKMVFSISSVGYIYPSFPLPIVYAKLSLLPTFSKFSNLRLLVHSVPAFTLASHRTQYTNSWNFSGYSIGIYKMGEDLAVAIIVPANNDAERGLDWVARCESLSPYHRQFLEVEARKDNESDYSSDIGTRSKLQDPGDALKKMYKGHFLLAFSHVAKANSTLLWRIGYGRDQSSAPDKDVDIIVVPPEMPHGGVRPTHAFIQINAKSGCLMLAGVSSEFPVRYQLEDGMINLFLQDKHVLHQPVNRFYLGSLEFMLVFQNQSDQEYAYYVRTRNEHLENHGKPLPHAAICALPRRVHLRTCGVIVHDTLWKGAYGTVKAAVDSRTGDPMAIKEAALLTDSAVREFRNELNLNRAFPVSLFLNV